MKSKSIGTKRKVLKQANRLVSSSCVKISLENYLMVVNILEDAALVIKKEKVEESKKSEQSGQLYNILLAYVQKLK